MILVISLFKNIKKRLLIFLKIYIIYITITIPLNVLELKILKKKQKMQQNNIKKI